MRSLVVLLLLVSSTAAAEEHSMAVAVNSPAGWVHDESYAVSAYGRIADHHAVRLNVAAYRYHYGSDSLLEHIREARDAFEYSGRTGSAFDLGAAWTYFPRRVFDGPTLELGALWRRSDIDHLHEFEEATRVETDRYAARALVGWSWLIHDRAFIAVAVGGAAGYERGVETNRRTEGDPMPMSSDVSRFSPSLEGYLRFGFTFGR